MNLRWNRKTLRSAARQDIAQQSSAAVFAGQSRRADQSRRKIGTRTIKAGSAGEQGTALVELAVTLPIALTMLMGFLSLGVLLNKQLQLTNGTSLSGAALALDRGATTDPCAATITAFQTAAPFLDPNAATFTWSLNNNAVTYSGVKTCTGGAASLVQGSYATVTVLYPCSIVFMGVFGKDSLTSSCKISSQVTEIIQ
jgi:hypothetical protein